MIKQLNIPSPTQYLGKINHGVNVFVKREDLIHPLFGGNKWRKLKYNLEYCRENDITTLVTFGGAFSNHIVATAHACNHFDVKAVGIIRGIYEDPDNPTLQAARSAGMELFHVSKEEYKLKDNSPLIKETLDKCDEHFLVPEGGSNLYGRRGVMEMMNEIEDLEMYDYIFVAAGTGMTAAGIISSTTEDNRVFVVNVLRNKGLGAVINNNLIGDPENYSVLHDYHQGGYAKVPDNIISFNSSFWKKYGILLDPIYNAKAMYALFDMVDEGKLKPDSNVLYIHTGGLQGIAAYEYVQKSKWIS